MQQNTPRQKLFHALLCRPDGRPYCDLTVTNGHLYYCDVAVGLSFDVSVVQIVRSWHPTLRDTRRTLAKMIFRSSVWAATRATRMLFGCSLLELSRTGLFGRTRRCYMWFNLAARFPLASLKPNREKSTLFCTVTNSSNLSTDNRGQHEDSFISWFSFGRLRGRPFQDPSSAESLEHGEHAFRMKSFGLVQFKG